MWHGFSYTYIPLVLSFVLTVAFVAAARKKEFCDGDLLKITCAVMVAGLVVFLGMDRFKTPEISLYGDKEIVLEVGTENFDDPGAHATLMGQHGDMKVASESNVDFSKVGDYEIGYSFVVNGKTYTASRKVKIKDTTPPEIKLVIPEKGEMVSKAEWYKDAGYSSFDNGSGDVTDSVTYTDNVKGDYLIRTYTSVDECGNTATAERRILIKDVVPPEIKITGGTTVNINKGDKFTDLGAEAVDDIDGAVEVTAEGAVNPQVTGKYYITYTAKDSCGNTAKATRTVIVKAPYTAPIKLPSDGEAPGVIYLTFDDGPSSVVTVRILDILKANGATATFFINGYTDDKIPILKRMIAEGHTIGLHGMSHDYSVAYASEDAFIKNINSLRDKLMADTGYKADIIRFPGGSSNTVSRKYCSGVMSKLVNRVQSEGYQYFDWNIVSGDAYGSKTASGRLISNVTNGLKHNRNNIVLMHDSNTKTMTADALQSMITYGKDSGYKFASLNRGTPPIHQKVNN